MGTPSAFAGRLSLVSLSDLLETMQANNTTGELRLKTDFGSATVWFESGQLLDAKIGSFQGEAAVFRLLGLTDGSFEVKSVPVSRSRVITQPVRALLRRRSQRSQEWKALVEKLPPLGTVLVLDLQSFSSASANLTEEQLSVVQLVDGRRAIFEIIDDSGRDAVEVLRIVEQLIARGLVSADADGVGGGSGYRDPREDESGVLPPSSRALDPSAPPSAAASARAANDSTDSDRAEAYRAANDGAAAGERRASDRASGARAGSDRPGSDRPGSDRPGSDRPGSDRPGSDRPGSDRPSNRAASGSPSSDRGSSDRASGNRAASERAPSDPAASDRFLPRRAPSDPAASSPESMGVPTQPQLYKPPASVPSPSQIRGGPKLGRYEVLSRLGRGGMGTVYLARITGDGGFRRLFAIKVLRSHLSRSDEAGQMLLKEARIASRVDHPNIVSVVDVGSHEGQPYLVMDYVTGCSLADLLRANKKYSTAAAVSIILDTLAGLHAAHTLADDDGVSLDVIHHDVSPHNIMVGLDGIARLSDFGVAFVRRSIGEPEEASRGKPAFTAPERVKGGAGDRRSDVFSVGVILWNVLSGASLFDGPDIETTLENVLTRPIPPASRHGRSPESLDAVCFKALQRQPEKRYQSAEEMLVHLRKVAASEDLLGSPSEVKQWVKDAMGHELDVQRLSFLDAARMAREAEASSNLLPVRQGREEGPASDASRTIELGKAERRGAAAKWVAVGLGVLILLAAAFWPGKFKRKTMPPPVPPGPTSVTAPLAPRAPLAVTKGAAPAAAVPPPATAAPPAAATPQPAASQPVASQPVASQPVAAPVVAQPVQPSAPVSPAPAAVSPAPPAAVTPPAAPSPAGALIARQPVVPPPAAKPAPSAAPSGAAPAPAQPPVAAPPAATRPATPPAAAPPAATRPATPPAAAPAPATPPAAAPPSASPPSASFPPAAAPPAAAPPAAKAAPAAPPPAAAPRPAAPENKPAAPPPPAYP